MKPIAPITEPFIHLPPYVDFRQAKMRPPFYQWLTSVLTGSRVIG